MGRPWADHGQTFNKTTAEVGQNPTLRLSQFGSPQVFRVLCTVTGYLSWPFLVEPHSLPHRTSAEEPSLCGLVDGTRSEAMTPWMTPAAWSGGGRNQKTTRSIFNQFLRRIHFPSELPEHLDFRFASGSSFFFWDQDRLRMCLKQDGFILIPIIAP